MLHRIHPAPRRSGRKLTGTTTGKDTAVNAIDLEVIHQATLKIARELTLNMLLTGY